MSHPDRRYFWVYMRAKKVGWFTPILDMRNSYVTVSVERNVTLLPVKASVTTPTLRGFRESPMECWKKDGLMDTAALAKTGADDGYFESRGGSEFRGCGGASLECFKDALAGSWAGAGLWGKDTGSTTKTGVLGAGALNPKPFLTPVTCPTSRDQVLLVAGSALTNGNDVINLKHHVRCPLAAISAGKPVTLQYPEAECVPTLQPTTCLSHHLTVYRKNRQSQVLRRLLRLPVMGGE